jgi:hypothetical protein
MPDLHFSEEIIRGIFPHNNQPETEAAHYVPKNQDRAQKCSLFLRHHDVDGIFFPYLAPAQSPSIVQGCKSVIKCYISASSCPAVKLKPAAYRDSSL